MATSEYIKQLVINIVSSQEVYDYMEANGLIKENEPYLVYGSEETIQSITTAEIDAMFD